MNVPKGSSVVVAKLVSTPEYELPAEADQGKRGFVLNLFFRYNLSRPLHISEVRLQQLTQSRPWILSDPKSSIAPLLVASKEQVFACSIVEPQWAYILEQLGLFPGMRNVASAKDGQRSIL